MRADNEFLLAIAAKLKEIADETADVHTECELNEFIDKIYESIQ